MQTAAVGDPLGNRTGGKAVNGKEKQNTHCKHNQEAIEADAERTRVRKT